MDSKNEGAHDDASHYFCEEAHEVVVRTAGRVANPEVSRRMGQIGLVFMLC